MTGINAWVEMEHEDHELGEPCRDCQPENDYSENSML